jgi:sugar lactone lactonase YvrE
MNEKAYLGKLFVTSIIALVFLSFGFVITPEAKAKPFKSSLPTVVDPGYKIQILVPGSYFHGIHGLTFDSQDNLYAGSVVGQSIYHVDTDTGDVSVFIGPPNGMADDLEFGPDGRIYYTSFLMGKVHAKGADGKVTVLAEGLPGINSLAFNQEGRLFATQVFLGDALYEIDLSGQKNTRMIAEKLGGLNGFDFGSDGYLYGPLWFKKAIGKVDVNTGQIEVVAEGFTVPAAANFDSKGNLIVVDTAVGEVIQVDVTTGEKKVIAKVDSSIDNLAINSKDQIYITNMSNNGVYEVDKKTGKARTVVEGKLACAQGVAVSSDPNGDTLYLANSFSYLKLDGFTGDTISGIRMHTAGKHLEYPNTASVHGDSVLLTSWFTGVVQEIDRKTDETKRMPHGFKAPSHALMMDDGSIIVAEIGTGSLVKVTDQEGKERTVVAKDLIVPIYLAPAGPDGVYVTEAMAGTISRIDLSTGEKKVVASGLRMPEGIAVFPDGKLLVVETGTRQLLKIDPASGAITPLVINLAVGFPSYPGGLPPYLITGVAVSDSGTIYVTGDLENVLYKISPK